MKGSLTGNWFDPHNVQCSRMCGIPDKQNKIKNSYSANTYETKEGTLYETQETLKRTK